MEKFFFAKVDSVSVNELFSLCTLLNTVKITNSVLWSYQQEDKLLLLTKKFGINSGKTVRTMYWVLQFIPFENKGFNMKYSGYIWPFSNTTNLWGSQTIWEIIKAPMERCHFQHMEFPEYCSLISTHSAFYLFFYLACHHLQAYSNYQCFRLPWTRNR